MVSGRDELTAGGRDDLGTRGHELPAGGRDELAARQRSLVAALVAGAAPPPGVDPGRVRVQATALLRKRGRTVARAQPELAATLGPAFGEAFAEYVHSRPWWMPDSTAADAREFARYLRGAGGRPYLSADVRRAARRVARPWPLRSR